MGTWFLYRNWLYVEILDESGILCGPWKIREEYAEDKYHYQHRDVL